MLSVFAAISLLMPSSDSFWIDEAFTGLYSKQASFSDFSEYLIFHPNTEMKTPLHVLWAWLAGRVNDSDEWLLRISNVPWVLLGLWFIFCIGKRLKMTLLPAFFIVSPFVWFYANEFRPYAMQIAGGAAWLLFCIRILQGEYVERCLGFYLAAVFLWSSSMLGLLPLASMLGVTILILLCRRRLSLGRFISISIPLAIVLLPLAVYYMWTISVGTGGGGKSWAVSWKNILFVAYEYLGYTGLGPSRLQLRNAMQGVTELASVVEAWQIALMVPLTIVYLILIGYTVRLIMPNRIMYEKRAYEVLSRDVVVLCAVSIAASIGALYIVVYSAGWPLWGRHLAAYISAVYVIIVISLRSINYPWLRRVLAGVLLVVLVVSSLLLRFSDRHRRDDYRGAAISAKAKLDGGGIVWWAAAKQCALFYDLPASKTDHEFEPNRVVLLSNPVYEEIERLPNPDYIYLSRIDIFDRYNVVRSYLIENEYSIEKSLTGFTVWRK
jgi:hypothetical protein